MSVLPAGSDTFYAGLGMHIANKPREQHPEDNAAGGGEGSGSLDDMYKSYRSNRSGGCSCEARHVRACVCVCVGVRVRLRLCACVLVHVVNSTPRTRQPMVGRDP